MRLSPQIARDANPASVFFNTDMRRIGEEIAKCQQPLVYDFTNINSRSAMNNMPSTFRPWYKSPLEVLAVAVLSGLSIWAFLQVVPHQWIDHFDGPAWVQAIGSVAAIYFTGHFAREQSKRDKMEAAKSFAALANAALTAFPKITRQFNKRIDLYYAASGHRDHEFLELRSVRDVLGQVAFHTLPSELVLIAISLSATARQCAFKIDSCMQRAAKMDAEDFEDLFLCMRQMEDSWSNLKLNLDRALGQLGIPAEPQN